MKRIILIFFFVFLALPLVPNISLGQDTNISSSEEFFLYLINEARKDFSDVAHKLGLNLERFSAEKSWSNLVLNGELKGLVIDHRLQKAARLHNQDMLAKSYLGPTSPEGQTCPDLALEQGYISSSIKDEISYIAFDNYLQPQEAAFALFRKMLKEELEHDRSSELSILNPELNDIGLSLNPGRLSIDGVKKNGYVVTIIIGSQYAQYESGLWRLINEVRSDPKAVFKYFGFDLTDIKKTLAGESWILDKGLSPVVRFSPDKDINRPDSINQAGRKVEIWVQSQKSGPELVEDMFYRLIQRDLASQEENRLILNQEVNQIGLEIANSSLVNSGYYKIILTTPQAINEPKYFVLGALYDNELAEKQANQEFYGLEYVVDHHLKVELTDPWTGKTLVSSTVDNFGGFQVPFPKPLPVFFMIRLNLVDKQKDQIVYSKSYSLSKESDWYKLYIPDILN